MKDLYKNEKRWEDWKLNYYNKAPNGITKESWKLLIEFLKDMELGLNTPVGKKGRRTTGTLLNLSSHNKIMLEHLHKPIKKLTKKDIHKLEQDIITGEITRNDGKKYTAFGNYIKDFKVFWKWLMRTQVVNEDITEDITSKTNKPSWVYLSEKDIRKFFNQLSFDYRVYCFFLYDTGARVTEALNTRVKDFSEDFSKVTIREEVAKTFERTINLKLCTSLIKEYIKVNNLKDDDYIINRKPYTINKYLRYHCVKMFGKGKISHPKSKGAYEEFTMYDIRHNSACFWFNKYPTHKGIMYRFGWRNADKIEYYSGFLGVADELVDIDMVLGADRDKLLKLEDHNKKMQKEIDRLNQMVKTMWKGYAEQNKVLKTAVKILK